MTLPIPLSEAEALAKTYGWDQITVIAHKSGTRLGQMLTHGDGLGQSFEIGDQGAVLIFPERVNAEKLRWLRSQLDAEIAKRDPEQTPASSQSSHNPKA